MAAYDRAIAIKPENAEAWRDRGAVVSEFIQDTDKIDSGESDMTNAQIPRWSNLSQQIRCKN